MVIEKTLSNGIRVVGEHLPTFRSVAVGVWLKTGSIIETPDQSGISHFIEHMLFKGTQKRSARDIAAQMDAIGGQINAFTAKECTCYYVKVIDEHVNIGLDILSDMLMNSKFDPDDISKEKGVIVEEIGMSVDNPEDYVHELINRTHYRGHPLEHPILGTAESVNAMDRGKLLGYLHEHYGADDAVISIAGNFDPERITGQIEEYFGTLDFTNNETPTTGVKADAKPGAGNGVSERGSISIAQREIEQVHICLGLPGYSMDDAKRYPMLVLNNLFGGSMSSRLFQSIREERGLAYSVYSYPSAYSDTGMVGVYAGTSPHQVEAVLELTVKEIKTLLQDKITKDEFEQSREQLKGNYILGMEGTSSHMTALGKNMTLLGKVVSEEDVIKKIDAVTMDDVVETMTQIFDFGKISAALVGKVEDQERVRSILS
ncbi:MAG: M16 family metallopeptidase [Bacillota bacterium]